MTATFFELETLRRIKKEQDKERVAREEDLATKIGRSARVRLFHWLPPFLGIIPRVKFNPHAWKQGKIISETEHGAGMEYTIRFQIDQPYWDYYPANAIEILPETKT